MENPPPTWTSPPLPKPLRGDEPFLGLPDASVIDFWSFALPDLKVNNARGLLAEFLVQRAVGGNQPRVEWASHDVETDDGLRIEVKTSAYVQAWEQQRPSAIRFSGLRSRTWSATTGYSDHETFNADVYVFAVQTARDHDSYDALNISQWKFYVLPRLTLERLGHNSLGLTTVRSMAGRPLPFTELAAAIRAADPRSPNDRSPVNGASSGER